MRRRTTPLLRRALALLTVAAVFGGVAAGPAAASPGKGHKLGSDGQSLSAKAIPDKWLVQVRGSSVLQGGNAGDIRNRQSGVRAAASSAGIKLTLQHTYTRVWNGFSVKATQEAADRLRAIPGVAAIFPVYEVDLPKEKIKTQLVHSVPMIGGDLAHTAGWTGAGVKVGVIDTGIDYNHPDLGGSGVNDQTADFPGTRVQYGYDLVGDAYTGSNDPTPDAYPDDCNGHGTHVAGIIGADGDPLSGHVEGVAPDVTFGAYRVFGCSGSTDTEIILEAMDMANADGMDVINLSLGDSFVTWPNYPTGAAASALTAAGTIVVASEGNSAASGLFSSGSPAVGKSVISVASIENTDVSYRSFSVSPAPGGTSGSFFFLPAAGGVTTPTTGTFPLVNSSVVNGCSTPASLTGKVALIQRGTCTFYQKAYNAQLAGAEGVVIYNNTTGMLTPTVAGSPAVTIPVVFISQDDGNALAAQVGGTSTTLTWTSEVGSKPNPLAGLVSDFSSFGMAADLTVNPDVAAPGGNIWSTFPIEEGSYANLSGTSMAAPHVTGSVALLLQAKPALKGNVNGLRAALGNSATPVNQTVTATGSVVSGYEPVIRQGAGLINVYQAILDATKGTTVTPAKISLGENRTRYYKTTLTLTNAGGSDEKYKLSVVNARNIGAAPTTYWYDYKDKKVSAYFSANSVTVKKHSTARVSVYLKQPALSTGWIYGGWVKLTKSDNSKVLVVPFAGMYGDYQKVKALQDYYSTSTPEVWANLPGLGFPSGGSWYLVNPGDPMPVFNLSDASNTPYLLFHLDYPVAAAYFNVYKAKPDGTKGAEVFTGYKTFLRATELGRDDDFLYLPFDGKIPFDPTTGDSTGVTVPNGDYVLEIKVLKAGGRASNPAHWETKVTRAFTIDRSAP